MQAVFDQIDLRLNYNDVLTLRRAAAAAITVATGSIWITQHGKAQDHVLSAGQRLTVEGDAPVVVAALSAARLTVAAPRHERAGAVHRSRQFKAWFLRLMRRMRARAAVRHARRFAYY